MSRLQASSERCATTHLAVLAGASGHWLEQHAHQRVSNHRPMVMDQEAGLVVEPLPITLTLLRCRRSMGVLVKSFCHEILPSI